MCSQDLDRPTKVPCCLLMAVNMQDDDMDDEEDEYEESEDGFVVPNGYISEDEGLGSVQQSLNDLCADLEGISASLRCFHACIGLSVLLHNGGEPLSIDSAQSQATGSCC